MLSGGTGGTTWKESAAQSKKKDKKMLQGLNLEIK